MSTYRERRERRAEKLRDWATSHDAKATVTRADADRIADMIPMGQPILVGHHSEKRHRRDLDRIEHGMRASIEHAQTADEQRSRADEIERQLDASIYNDDPDAPERLAEKIERLEAVRERIKAYNASCRKAAKTGGVGDVSLLDDHQRQGLENLKRYCPYQIGKGGALPAYELSNLGGNIKRLRDRLAQIKREREHGPVDRMIFARFDSQCAQCDAQLSKGDRIRYNRQQGARCLTCQEV